MGSKNKVFSWKSFLLISFLFGIIFSTESFFLFFSLNLNKTSFFNKVAEKVYWKCLDPLVIRYSPFFYVYWNSLKIKFEEIIPSYIDLVRLNFINYIVSEKQKNVLIVIKWNNSVFFISDDGSIWLVDYSVNKEMNFCGTSYGVPWRISDTFPSPIQGESIVKDRVCSTTLPIALLKYWKRCFSLHEWYKSTEDLLLERRAGKYIFHVVLGKELKETELILDGSAEGLNERIVAVDDVLQGVRETAKKSIIDVTYQDKIVVKSVSDDL